MLDCHGFVKGIIAKDFNETANKYRHERFVEPILSVIVSLPKEELANLAEALVNLTSIKRRFSE